MNGKRREEEGGIGRKREEFGGIGRKREEGGKKRKEERENMEPNGKQRETDTKYRYTTIYYKMQQSIAIHCYQAL